MSDAGFLIGTLLIFSLVIYVIFSSKKIKALGISIAVMILYVGYVKFSCGPNPFVVRTATPIMEKIADYIVENGLPERLDEIPDLPYKLKECTKKEVYWKEHDVVKRKKDADWMELFYSCKFFKNKTMYKINSRFAKTFSIDKWSGDLDITSKETWVGSLFKSQDDKKIILDVTKSGSHSRTGICQPFRQ